MREKEEICGTQFRIWANKLIKYKLIMERKVL